jgi:PhnB protein
MSARLNPYISFDGTAREALEAYKGIFGGELTTSTYGEFGNAEGGDADKIMHGNLDTPSGFTLMAADNPPHEKFEPGNNMSISLSGDSGDELRGYFEKLAEGGTITVPLEKQMWGDEFGMCIDRFGIAWMVNIGQPQA